MNAADKRGRVLRLAQQEGELLCPCFFAVTSYKYADLAHHPRCPFSVFPSLFVALCHRKPGMKAGGIAGFFATAGVAAATHFVPRYGGGPIIPDEADVEYCR